DKLPRRADDLPPAILVAGVYGFLNSSGVGRCAFGAGAVVGYVKFKCFAHLIFILWQVMFYLLSINTAVYFLIMSAIVIRLRFYITILRQVGTCPTSWPTLPHLESSLIHQPLAFIPVRTLPSGG